MSTNTFDVIVIGGGHAGAEAAHAAARLGARTALVTFQREAIGRMSCNPAIGGIGKGQMVREVDALGGLMGLVTDETGIQFRMLNRRKGPAVWAPRAQCDREEYARAVRRRLEATENLTIIEGGVDRIDADDVPRLCELAVTHIFQEWPSGAENAALGSRPGPRRTPLAAAGEGVARDVGNSKLCEQWHEGAGVANGDTPPPAARQELRPPPSPHPPPSPRPHDAAEARIVGITLGDGRSLRAPAVVVTSGTFLRALMHTGEQKTEGGRVGEAAAVGLSASLARLGLQLGRLKTGTPPRVDRSTVDFDRLETQPGDDPPTPFSFMSDRVTDQQVPCWISYTTPEIHDLIRANLHRAPMFSGQIQSRGPRYCPSIEDKVVRFADKEKHQLFLEPEGRSSDRIYVNGISTSLPQDVQARIVAGVAGLENARVLQWGYAVEYDFVPPEQIDATLMTRRVAGLFLAGQINGTSGYEEAAGQGLIAGINAARFVAGRAPLIMGRDQAYIGVMIDDLVTRGVTEPYRMFSSRAEHRLHLRYDNADVRLTPLGRELGLVEGERWRRYQDRRSACDELRRLLHTLRMEHRSLAELLRQPEEDGRRFMDAWPELRPFAARPDVWATVLVDVKYAGYVERQNRAIELFRELEDVALPPALDFAAIPALRREAVERWSAVRPRSLGQAARVSGIHPTDVSLLMVGLRATSSTI